MFAMTEYFDDGRIEDHGDLTARQLRKYLNYLKPNMRLRDFRVYDSPVSFSTCDAVIYVTRID